MNICIGILIGGGGSSGNGNIDSYWYGVQWDTSVQDPVLTRIGKSELHASLPIQSLMRRCLLRDDGTVNYYLNTTTSTLKETGGAADLTGTDGQVVVEIPDFYIRFESELTVRRCMMSTFALPGYTKIPKMYISAYEASLDRTNLKLSSVVNTTAQYRGGNNIAAWDATSKTLLGRPVTMLNSTQLRTYARNRGSVAWNYYTYLAQKVIYWLYVVEYANFNSQLPFTSTPTAQGYKQGGLGMGVTDLDSTKLNTFNGNNPFIPCGITNSLGNASGQVAYTMPTEYDSVSKTVYANSYRGIENVFGHIVKLADGCKLNVQSDTSGGLSEFYVCNNPANFQDTDLTNYTFRGIIPRVENYITSLMVGAEGDIMPLTVGGGSATTYMSDYLFAAPPPASGVELRAIYFGGFVNYSTRAGISFVGANLTPTSARNHIGTRLCYMPQ